MTTFVPSSYVQLAANELQLRLNRQTSAYDLGQEMIIQDQPHFVFATIDRPVNGKIEREARALQFGTGSVTEISLTYL